MAAGDVTWFNEAKKGLGLKLHNLSTDAIKFALIKNPSFSMLATVADPRWGSGGTTNLSSEEVTVAGAYTATISVESKTWTEAAGVVTWDHADVSIGGNASNPSTARWGIYYNDSDAGKRCLAFVDFGATLDINAGFAWRPAATGVMTIT